MPDGYAISKQLYASGMENNITQTAFGNTSEIFSSAAEFGDAKPYITGSSLDSYHALLAWGGLKTFLSTQYVSDTTIGHFQIFRLNHDLGRL